MSKFELVIDTQVLVDASNPYSNKFDSTSFFLDIILGKILEEAKEIAICIDAKDGNGDYHFFDPGKNDSMIISEYSHELGRKNLDKPGWRFLKVLDEKTLILTKPKWPEKKKKDFIRCHIKKCKQIDKILIGVTCNCKSSTLISDEEEDFTKAIRKIVRNKPLKIQILHSNNDDLLAAISII